MYIPELSWLYASELIRFFSVGLCLGTSTVVMTLYFYLVAKGKTEPSEKKIMHVLYTILRVGMGLAVITEITGFIYNYHVDNFIYWIDNPELLMRFTIFSVILADALAMQNHRISMWFGPALAGGSWYGYFFFSVWVETETTYPVLLAGYVSWLLCVFIFLTALRLYLTRNQDNRIGDGASDNAAVNLNAN